MTVEDEEGKHQAEEGNNEMVANGDDDEDEDMNDDNDEAAGEKKKKKNKSEYLPTLIVSLYISSAVPYPMNYSNTQQRKRRRRKQRRRPLPTAMRREHLPTRPRAACSMMVALQTITLLAVRRSRRLSPSSNSFATSLVMMNRMEQIIIFQSFPLVKFRSIPWNRMFTGSRRPS
jgi:hypothetical protein